jgi:hypothetical protein
VSRTRFSADYAEYYEKHQSLLDEQDRFKVRARPIPTWYSSLPDEYELQDIERFITWRNRNRDLVTIRLEYDRCSVFANSPVSGTTHFAPVLAGTENASCAVLLS